MRYAILVCIIIHIILRVKFTLDHKQRVEDLLENIAQKDKLIADYKAILSDRQSYISQWEDRVYDARQDMARSNLAYTLDRLSAIYARRMARLSPEPSANVV